MQVVDVLEWQEAMERGIDRCSNRVVPEGAQRIHIRHLIFEIDAAVDVLQSVKLLEIQRRKTAALHAAEIAAASLHPQHLNLLPRKRVSLERLGAGVASGEV